MYKVTAATIIILILCGYIFFSKPDTVVVTEAGKVEGLVNKARAVLQGNRFWKLQLKMANELYDKSIGPQIPSSAEMQELYHKLAEDEKKLNEKMKALYTPEERMAELYRMKADSIERAGKWRVIDDAAIELTRKDSEKYMTLIPIIESKIKSRKLPDKPKL